ncbi:MAG TPA: cytochrome c oxidase subunit I [Phycisphaerae bacterium]|nr:cytochrome c oxidase subunit I [Phycisphaerae bacterium]
MSAIDPGISLPAGQPQAAAGDNYLTRTRGIRSWLFTVDHKRIGIMYLVSILAAFLLGGIFAILIRTELLTPQRTIMSADNYNRVFTLHGAIMTFLVIIPGIPAALGNFVLPIMLGAKDLAFPRLNLFSYHLWVLGALLSVVAILMGSVDTGWTFYVPYATDTSMGGVIPVLLGVFVLGFSSIFTGLNFVVTIHKLRPPGMTWFRLPLFLWALYATAIIQILATPVLGITVLLLIVERAFELGIFQPGLGGDPLLYQHFFWFYSHPAVYIMILPAMGIASEVISIFSRKHIFGYHFIAFSSIAIAIFGFLVWGHHMFVSGQSALVTTIFSLLTYSVSIPSAVKVFNWLATLHGGSISLKTPMLYMLGFIFIFGIGGLTGLFLGALATDYHLTDTYFVVAHFHYVMMGSTLLAMIGGIHHWWPKMTGRMYSELWGRVAFVVVFVGFNLTFFPQFIMGTHGMPRRYYNYPPQFEFLHVLSSIGSYLMAVGFVITAIYLLHSLFAGRRAPANPWGGATLEWQCASPPPTQNFDTLPVAGDPYDFSDLEYDARTGGYVRVNRPGASVPGH